MKKEKKTPSYECTNKYVRIVLTRRTSYYRLSIWDKCCWRLRIEWIIRSKRASMKIYVLSLIIQRTILSNQHLPSLYFNNFFLAMFITPPSLYVIQVRYYWTNRENHWSYYNVTICSMIDWIVCNFFCCSLFLFCFCLQGLEMPESVPRTGSLLRYRISWIYLQRNGGARTGTDLQREICSGWKARLWVSCEVLYRRRRYHYRTNNW